MHAESDGLPGVHIDRYGDHISIIIHCSGMAQGNLSRSLVRAVEDVLDPSVIIFRHDSSSDRSSRANGQVELYKGVYDEPIELLESSVTHVVDLKKGSGTGFDYHHRANRSKISAIAGNRKVLDLYSGGGAFGLHCCSAGAKSVTFVDTKQENLDLAQRAIDLNGFSHQVH